MTIFALLTKACGVPHPNCPKWHNNGNNYKGTWTNYKIALPWLPNKTNVYPSQSAPNNNKTYNSPPNYLNLTSNPESSLISSQGSPFWRGRRKCCRWKGRGRKKLWSRPLGSIRGSSGRHSWHSSPRRKTMTGGGGSLRIGLASLRGTMMSSGGRSDSSRKYTGDSISNRPASSNSANKTRNWPACSTSGTDNTPPYNKKRPKSSL